jgi:hypothetical protein
MKKSIAFQALTFFVGIAICFAGVVLPPNAAADGTNGDPPPPNPPVDTTITITSTVPPIEPPETSTASSLWDDILSLLTF